MVCFYKQVTGRNIISDEKRCYKQLKLFNCVQSSQTNRTKSYLKKVFITVKPMKNKIKN